MCAHTGNHRTVHWRHVWWRRVTEDIFSELCAAPRPVAGPTGPRRHSHLAQVPLLFQQPRVDAYGRM